MLDFLFRRGNPTNDWRRSTDLILTATLDEPLLNGVALGSRFEHLSSLGRNDGSQLGSLCYFDLGVRVAPGKDGTFQGFAIVLADEDDEFQPYRGTLSWNTLVETQSVGSTPLDSQRPAQRFRRLVLDRY
mgnify:CR=1 FL=1